MEAQLGHLVESAENVSRALEALKISGIIPNSHRNYPFVVFLFLVKYTILVKSLSIYIDINQGEDIRSAMRVADERMYADKKAYYAKYPERKYRG